MDLSKGEQVAFCLRYLEFFTNGIKSEFKIHERFISFYLTESTTGENLEKLVLEKLSSLGLDPENLVGQAYDGASNINKICKVLATRLKEKYPKALYVHCHAHRLNLALADACSSITEIRNALGTVNSLHSYIEASAKRHAVFKNIAKLEDAYETLKHISDTRWASRKAAISSMKATFSSVLKCLKV